MRASSLLGRFCCAVLALVALGTRAQIVETISSGGAEPRVQVIVVEDDRARIEELRVRGETRSVKVQPKGPGPKAPYEIQPVRASRDPSQVSTPQRGLDGQRVWKVLSF